MMTSGGLKDASDPPGVCDGAAGLSIPPLPLAPPSVPPWLSLPPLPFYLPDSRFYDPDVRKMCLNEN